MADRNGAPSRTAGGSGLSRARTASSSSSSAQVQNSNSNNVRRNLFQNNLTRRPTPSNSADMLDVVGKQQQQRGDDAFGTSDIVVRDKNGEIELDDPPPPILDDPDEMALDSRQENEKERQRLADAVKSHQNNRNSVPVQPEELLEAVRTSLRAKVAALSEDNWMFEKEEVAPDR